MKNFMNKIPLIINEYSIVKMSSEKLLKEGEYITIDVSPLSVDYV